MATKGIVMYCCSNMRRFMCPKVLRVSGLETRVLLLLGWLISHVVFFANRYFRDALCCLKNLKKEIWKPPEHRTFGVGDTHRDSEAQLENSTPCTLLTDTKLNADHLFRSLPNAIRGVELENDFELENRQSGVKTFKIKQF